MKFLLIVSLIIGITLILPVKVYSQDSPPAMASPKKQNLKLIDELIEVTDFKNVFRAYCISRISKESQENHWSDAKIQEITNSINFRYFEWVVQNVLASYSKKELQDLLEKYKADPTKSRSDNIIFNNSLVRKNLENFSVELLKGSYVMPNKE